MIWGLDVRGAASTRENIADAAPDYLDGLSNEAYKEGFVSQFPWSQIRVLHKGSTRLACKGLCAKKSPERGLRRNGLARLALRQLSAAPPRSQSHTVTEPTLSSVASSTEEAAVPTARPYIAAKI